MTDRLVVCVCRGALSFFLFMTAACRPSADAPKLRLTPLGPRPEDPNRNAIYDQNDLMASASPDGEHILFTSRRSGEFRQYVMKVDGSGVHMDHQAYPQSKSAHMLPGKSRLAAGDVALAKATSGPSRSIPKMNRSRCFSTSLGQSEVRPTRTPPRRLPDERNTAAMKGKETT